MKKIIVLLLLLMFCMPAYCDSFEDFRQCILYSKSCNKPKVQNDNYAISTEYITLNNKSVLYDGNGKAYKIGNDYIRYDRNGKIVSAYY